MYRRPNLLSLIGAILLVLLFAQDQAFAFRRQGSRTVAVGTTHSLKGVGVCADFDHDASCFRSVALTADLIDILDGKSSTPGLKLTYHYNLVFQSWAEGKYALYAGPGLMTGYVRDLNNHFGLAGGISGDAGFRVRCRNRFLVALEFQADLALQFKNRYRPDMSVFSAGYRHSYYPHVRIEYHF